MLVQQGSLELLTENNHIKYLKGHLTEKTLNCFSDVNHVQPGE